VDLDELLTTTKAVSKWLDLTRPVPMELVLDCIRIAVHAPVGGNREVNPGTGFSPAPRRPVAEIAFVNRWGVAPS
jgi:hypothetical protein